MQKQTGEKKGNKACHCGLIPTLSQPVTLSLAGCTPALPASFSGKHLSSNERGWCVQSQLQTSPIIQTSCLPVAKACCRISPETFQHQPALLSLLCIDSDLLRGSIA